MPLKKTLCQKVLFNKFDVSNNKSAIMNQNQVVTNNIVMNNYISFGNPGNPGHDIRKPFNNQKQVPIDDIMDFFSTRYKSILPNRVDTDFELQGTLFPFQKTEIVQLLQQMDILIQLLAQVLFLPLTLPIISNNFLEFSFRCHGGNQIQEL